MCVCVGDYAHESSTDGHFSLRRPLQNGVLLRVIQVYDACPPQLPFPPLFLLLVIRFDRPSLSVIVVVVVVDFFIDSGVLLPQVRVMEERLQAEWSTHLPDQAEKEQAISKLATQVEEQVTQYIYITVYGFCDGVDFSLHILFVLSARDYSVS